ncbi:hypothetical protein [Streptomyces sp. NPDC057413]
MTAPSETGAAPQPVPTWISDPELIASIEAGHIEIPDDLNTPEGGAHRG